MNKLLKLNIIIPVYNESARIGGTLEAFNTYLQKSKLDKRFNVAFYIVDDGSKDNTIDIINSIALDLKPRILTYEINKGKGYAVRYGILNSKPADLYYIADADLSTSWEFLDTFLRIHKKKKYDCIIGSRALAASKIKTSRVKYLLGRGSNLFINFFLGLNFKDTQCGYKLFTKNAIEAFKKQKLHGFGFDFEVLYLIKKSGLSTREIPVEWVNKALSKVKALDYLKTLRDLVRVRITRY